MDLVGGELELSGRLDGLGLLPMLKLEGIGLR